MTAAEVVTITQIENDRAELTLRTRVGWVPVSDLTKYFGNPVNGVNQ